MLAANPEPQETPKSPHEQYITVLFVVQTVDLN